MDHARSFEIQVKAIKEVKELDASGTTMIKLG
jgi:hypothetical protein